MTKLTQLRQRLSDLSDQGIAIAFSGGVDSSLLLALLQDIHQKTPFPLLVLYAHSSLQPEKEIEEVRELAGDCNLKIIEMSPMLIPEVLSNSRERCYHCKYHIFRQMREQANQHNSQHLIDGSNADDIELYRPGRRALREQGVISPLAELDINKRELRAMAEQMGLSTALKPASPCLATRFDYDTELSDKELTRAMQGEEILRKILSNTCQLRLRVHLPQLIARIEVEPSEFANLIEHREQIISELRRLGYQRISLDLQGFLSRSMDI